MASRFGFANYNYRSGFSSKSAKTICLTLHLLSVPKAQPKHTHFHLFQDHITNRKIPTIIHEHHPTQKLHNIHIKVLFSYFISCLNNEQQCVLKHSNR